MTATATTSRGAGQLSVPPQVWLMHSFDGPPLARVTVSLNPTGIYGTGPDEVSAMGDLLDEIDMWTTAATLPATGPEVQPPVTLREEDGVAAAARAAVLRQVKHLTRTARLHWLQSLPDKPGDKEPGGKGHGGKGHGGKGHGDA